MSSVHVAVLDVVEVLLQASVEINVLVCERPHPVLDTLPLVNVTVGVPQASVEVAVPNAASIVAADGLQPNARGLPVALMKGIV